MAWHRPAKPSERSIIRVGVFVGFGLVFALWAASAYDVGRNMAVVESRTVGFHRWFAETEMLLDNVRAAVLEASVDVRDALLDTTQPSDESYRRRLTDARHGAEQALRKYEPFLRSETERRELAELRHMVSDLWEVTEPILALDERNEQAAALASLRQQIGPRRRAIEEISAHIARLNESAADDQRAAVVGAFRAAERRAWLLGAATFGLTLAITLVVTHHADRMERRIRRETAKNVEHVQALQRLSDRLVRAGEEERRALARELHDEIGQTLTAVKLDLKKAIAARDQHPSLLDDVCGNVDEAIESVRTLSRMLHPMVLEDLGLAAAVAGHLRAFERRSGILVTFQHAGLDERLPRSLEACLYRIVQEGTNNVARHAAASRCGVRIECADGQVCASIEDDGRGMDASDDAAADPARGLGLIGMRERVLGFGGTVEVGGARGRGTTLHVRIPVPAGDQDAQRIASPL